MLYRAALLGVYPLLAAGGPLLCSHKVTKGLVTRGASLPHTAFALQTGQNHGLQLFALLRSRKPCFCKTCYALAAAQATIVLPAFVRSLSADGEKEKNMSLRGGTTWQSPRMYLLAMRLPRYARNDIFVKKFSRGLNILILNYPEEIIAVSVAHGDDLIAYLDAAAFDAIDLVEGYDV
ncbi:hypothetical protein SAMN05428975_3906 [Mucilaginibacter sp. OK268]|nr:hypothetical protein SAMN05428975_3906 [Mucilaginibacter sp. OK268]